MSSEVALYPTGKFAVAKDDNGVSRFVRTLKENDVKFADIPQLKIPGGGGKVWEIATPQGLKGEPAIEVVIVLVLGNRKGWWAEDLEEGDTNRPPNCASNDGIRGYGNHSLGQEPQFASKEHDCLTCQWNQFGSERKAGKGKDCKDFAIVFGFLPHSFLPVRLKVPATSLKAMRKYMLQDLAALGLDQWGVVTKLTLTPQKEGNRTWSTVNFELVKALDASEMARFQTIREGIDKHLQIPVVPLTAGDFRQAPTAAGAAPSTTAPSNDRTPTPAPTGEDTTTTPATN